jgi:predicted TIM-barrel fold metal-dependent hydrolase
MKVIDGHVHFDPEALALERMLACMDRHGIGQAALIAAICEPFRVKGVVMRTSQYMLRLNLLRLNPLGRLLYGTMVDKKGNFVLLTRKIRIYPEPDNALVAAAVEKHPDRFLGWVFVNPAVQEPLAELEKWGGHPGMVGAKAHPFMHSYPVSLLDPVAAWCMEHHRPLLVHLGGNRESGDYRRLPDRYPGLKIVYAHAGIPFFRELWGYARGKQGVYVDLSSPYLNRSLISSVVNYLGVDKCYYGTDGPYGSQAPGEDYDYGLIKGWIESLPLSGAEREKVFARNFEAIIGG